MSDLHERFGGWLTGGATAELPRDAALHASACDACRRDAAAFDALLAIDAGAASLPPLRASIHSAKLPPIRLLRGAVGVAAVVLLAVSVGIGAGGLLDRRPQLGAVPPTATPGGEGVLGGAGAPASTFDDASAEAGPSEPSASPAEEASPGASEEQPEPTSATGLATPGPVFTPVNTPPPSTIITPPVGTPRPSSPGGSTPPPQSPPPSLPTIATPVPTPVPPTPVPPTPTPTPVPPPPTPEPTPFGACNDLIDNDGDLLIDLTDPGCLLNDNEFSG